MSNDIKNDAKRKDISRTQLFVYRSQKGFLSCGNLLNYLTNTPPQSVYQQHRDCRK